MSRTFAAASVTANMLLSARSVLAVSNIKNKLSKRVLILKYISQKIKKQKILLKLLLKTVENL